jgi:hypothetical protein
VVKETHCIEKKIVSLWYNILLLLAIEQLKLSIMAHAVMALICT